MKATVMTAVLLPAIGAFADGASQSTDIPQAQFTPTTLKAPFIEQFDDGWDQRWQVSNAIKDDGATGAYSGRWAVEEPHVFPGITGDAGLVVKDKAHHHAISSRFPEPVDNEGKPLVIQYEVKLQTPLECGGAYMKLLREDSNLDSTEFSSNTPYVIMFGPDRCGTTDKVHFILQHKDQKTGEYVEKQLKNPPRINTQKLTSLYTLVIQPDQTFEILVNGVSSASGNMFDSFSPSINPPKTIPDKDDKKPEDWDERVMITDPDAVKPEDWDEDAPAYIDDPDAFKPDDWLDDEKELIHDPEAEKPAEWDDEQDGKWNGPLIANPKCKDVSGCGLWVHPKILNPNHKGKWTAPEIKNPNYKGVWQPREIENPDYWEDPTPSNVGKIGAVGFEIWTMQDNILFDNIYIGHSVEDAAKFKEETFDIKYAIEEAKQKAAAPPKENVEGKNGVNELVSELYNRLMMFYSVAQHDPLFAIKEMPLVAAGLGSAVLFTLALIFSLFGGSSKKAAPKADEKKVKKGKKAESKEPKDETAAATTSGADPNGDKSTPQKRS